MEQKYVIVFVTVASMDEAVIIARNVVEERLAACCNILPGVRSIYAWKGSIHDSSEVMCVMKTRATLFERLKNRVKEMHGYEVPEIISVEISSGLDEYLAWIGSSTSVP